MTNKAPTLQDTFLSAARRSDIPVTVFLMNGFQMRGTIAGYDPFIVILSADGKQNLIYKHTISTISPSRPMDLSVREGATQPPA